MPFTLERFCKIRPYLFHLTATGNLDRILATRTLQPASELLAIGGWKAPRTHPRRDHQIAEVEGQVVWIRDQKPLHAGNIAFEKGWDMARLLSLIDSHVFFWPGNTGGPIQAGRNHFERYADEQPAVLRISTREFLDANPGAVPLFCRFNSGAPRTVNGRKSPRGGTTYVSADAFGAASAKVQEVVFQRPVRVTPPAEVSSSYSGPWVPLR